MMQLILFFVMPMNYFSLVAILGYIAMAILLVGFPLIFYLGFKGEEERRRRTSRSSVKVVES